MSPVSQRQKPAATSSRNIPNPKNAFPARQESSGGPGRRGSSARDFKSAVPPTNAASPAIGPKPEAEILFQKYFKSVGPRTYAAQLKRAGNGNHFLVFTEGKRDDKTGEIRKTRLFVFSEDFGEFFKMLHETACHIRQNPVPDDVRKKREKYWAKQNGGAKPSGPPRPVSPRNGRA